MKQEDVGKVIDRSFKAQSFIDTHAHRITDHYLHACKKHPYFCDAIAPVDLDEKRRKGTLADYQENTSYSLATVRDNVAVDAQKGRLTWEMLLLCEMWEVCEAIANGNKAQAVEELYDCISVCLRAIDVIEGRQPLGKPQTISGNNAEK